MNIVIIGKRNCPHSVAAMKTARQVMKKKITGYGIAWGCILKLLSLSCVGCAVRQIRM